MVANERYRCDIMNENTSPLSVCSLFCGCGGLDYGFKKAGYNILWANDFDKYAVETYKYNFGNDVVLGDVNTISLGEIPDHDVLIGGFPCQPFSMMGLGKGFDDTRGTLFYRIVQIIDEKIAKGCKPKAIILENVRSLQTHDKGRTLLTIRNTLEKRLGYKVYTTVLNSADFGVPQKRNRTYIVCFADHEIQFDFPKTVELDRNLQDILEKQVNEKYFLSERILKTILSYGTGGFRAKPEIDLKIARPLTATMAKMHRACQDNYVTQNGRIRRLTPRECARLQGFPDTFGIPVSDSQAYKQFGNAVTVSVSFAVAQQVKVALEGKRSKSCE